MANDDDYMALLNRAKIACPEITENHERFEIPELDILQEGKITVFRNFIDKSRGGRIAGSDFSHSPFLFSVVPFIIQIAVGPYI